MNAIEVMVRTVNGGVFASVDYTIPAKSYIVKKAKDGSGAINPLWDRKDDIVVERQNVQINLGVVYENAINGRMVRKDIEPTFDAVAMKGKVAHITPHKNLCQNVDRSKTYIRYMPCKNGNSTSRMLLDGQDVTAALVPFQSVQKDGSSRQAAAGLDATEQIAWRTLTIDNIDAIRILGVEIKG